MTTKEIAEKIDAHLKRFEKDPKINAPYSPVGNPKTRLLYYWHAGARGCGRWISICYVAYQSRSSISKMDGERYLAWLDAGNVGRHFEALRAPRGSDAVAAARRGARLQRNGRPAGHGGGCRCDECRAVEGP